MELEMLGIIILLLLVVLLFSPIGLGGGLLYVPVLHYLAGLPFETAILGSLVLVLSTAIGSAQAHRTERMVSSTNVKAALWTALPGAAAGAMTSLWVIERVSDVSVKILVMGLTAWILLQAIRKMRAEAQAIVGEFDLVPYRLGSGVGGFSCGMLGIGGGAIYVTMNRGWGGLDVHQAAGTSFMISAWVVPIAVATHLIAGGPGELASFDPLVLLATPLLAVAVAFFGGRFAARHMPVNVITWIFITVVSLGLLRYAVDLSNMFI